MSMMKATMRAAVLLLALAGSSVGDTIGDASLGCPSGLSTCSYTGACCPDDYVCGPNACCDPSTPVTCDNNSCCATGEECCGDYCCPPGYTCSGSSCVPSYDTFVDSGKERAFKVVLVTPGHKAGNSTGLSGSTCTGPGEFCCGAPAGDVENCPSSARTDDCDAQNDCCCG